MTTIHCNTNVASFYALCNLISITNRPSTINNYQLLKAIFAKIDALHAELRESINKKTVKSDFEKHNRILDNAIRSMLYLQQSYLLSTDPVVFAAAQKIEQIIKKYGFKLVRESSKEEVALTDTLLRDLERPEMLNAISALPSMDMMIDGIRTALTNFEKSHQDYIKALVKEKTKRTATAIKKEYQKVLNEEFLPNIRAARIHFPDEFGSYVKTIDQMVLGNNRVVTRKSPIEKTEEEVV